MMFGVSEDYVSRTELNKVNQDTKLWEYIFEVQRIYGGEVLGSVIFGLNDYRSTTAIIEAICKRNEIDYGKTLGEVCILRRA